MKQSKHKQSKYFCSLFRVLTYLILLLPLSGFGQSQIEILGAEELVYDASIGKYQRCIGNVKFKQDQVYMDCDSAWFYEEINRIEAFGNIYIRQKDSFDLRGNYLEYNGDQRLAKVKEDVFLTDNKMVLRTQELEYDLNNKSAYYTNGGNIENEEDKLSSAIGTYYSRSKEFHFRKNVRLINPEYEMQSDTLIYNTASKMAYFHGPTYIFSEENTIFCNYGWYNTESNKSQFSKGAYIEGKENKLQADSMLYDRNSGYGEAFRNIWLSDTIEDVEIFGEYGQYWRFEKKTLITGSPIAVKFLDGDALYLKSDSMIDQTDTIGRHLEAFHAVRVFKTDLQAKSDSMSYNFTDSTIRFYSDPILWNDSSQITGDTIVVLRGGDGFKSMKAFNNGFMIEKDINAKYNQVKGKTINALLIGGKMDRILVDGNGQSVYYALDDSSANYSGVNDIVCGNMVLYMDSSSKVDNIHFLSQPKATFYPLEKFPTSKSRLAGFAWRSSERPKKSEFK